MTVDEGGELFPRNAPCAPAGAWLLSQHGGKWPPASAQTQDLVCPVDVPPDSGQVVLIKSENHIRIKFG